MAKTCPTAGKANSQSVWVALEEVTGILQKPTAADYIVPRGNASMTQTPGQSASEELSESLNVINQFQDAVEAGEASIPMYLRLSANGKMQGHNLFAAAMGDVQEPDTVAAVLTAEATDSSTTLEIGTVKGGFFPPAGIVTIGSEKVRYSGRTLDADGVVSTLTGCERGYAGTTVETHAVGDALTLSSRVFSQSVCRNTVSVWMKMDHTIFFASGGVVTATEFAFSNTGGQNIDFTVQFRRMGWVGRSFIAEAPSGSVIKVVDKDGKPAANAYSVGGYVKNTTQDMDNAGAGYRIVAVDADAGTISLDGNIVGFEEDDQLDAWFPPSTPIGDAIESRRISLLIDGNVGRIREGSISIGTPVEFLQEIGDEYPGENVDTTRELSITMNAYFRAENAPDIGRGYDGYEIPVVVRTGKKVGETLAIAMERVKMSTPEVSTDGASYTLDRTGAILGKNGEDAIYIIQE